MITQGFAQPHPATQSSVALSGLPTKLLPKRLVPHWVTSSADADIDSLPMELSSLGLHADRCKRSQGALFALRCTFDAIHSFVAPRVITTLVVSGFLIGICSLVT